MQPVIGVVHRGNSFGMPGVIEDAHCVVPIHSGDCPKSPNSRMPDFDKPKMNDLRRWLGGRLRDERVTLIRQLDEQHAILLDDFERQLDSMCSAPVIPEKSTRSGLSGKAWQRLGKMAWGGDNVLRTTASAETDSAKMSGIASFSMFLRSSFGSHENLNAEGNRIEELVKSQTFEVILCIVILLNATVMAVRLQYDGLNAGYNLGMRTYDVSAEEQWPCADIVLEVLDKMFVCLFTLELLVRMAGFRLRWLCSVWNYLDLIVVGIALASWSLSDSLTLNPSFLRLVRFGKLLRIVRVMRSNKLLESLKLLVASIQASFNTLCTSLCVLLLIQSVAGMLLSQLCESYINDKSQPEEVRREVFNYYGTFWRSMITMFEITFANWAPSCRLLLDNVSEWFGVFFLIYRCVVGFAMLSVIQAVFIQQTMKSAQLDDDFMISVKTREKEVYAQKLRRVFNRLDTSGDGLVSWEEFEVLLKEEHMKLLMSTLEVDVRDLETLFKLLDDGDGQISTEEFIDGLQRMKGSAKALDLVTLLKMTRRIEAKLNCGDCNIAYPASDPLSPLSRGLARKGDSQALCAGNSASACGSQSLKNGANGSQEVHVSPTKSPPIVVGEGLV